MVSTGKNSNLHSAKKEKNDEFYTQYNDIEKEMQAYLDYDPDVFRGKTILLPCDDPDWSNFTRYFAQNFERFGIKELISTSYVPQDENGQVGEHGKIYILARDINNDKKIDINDITWDYLEGNGDFRSQEIMALRDKADIIITNPPFSLFREFLSWIMETDKKFAIIGNMNALTYKDVFPLVKNNKAWLGATISSGDREFQVPDHYPLNAAGFRIDEKGNKFIRVKGVRWFTNIEHGRRHQPLKLMTMQDNIKFNQKIKDKSAYEKYDNYDAIEVPITLAIPSDYEGVMGVPISFFDKYNPEQFKIVGMDFNVKDGDLDELALSDWKGKLDRAYLNGKRMYSRVFIQRK